MRIRVDVGLIHYPVYNKNKEIITSAVTNLDLHDIARAAKTFGVDTFYIVTPLKDQQQLFQEILDHWLSGPGARYNEKRKNALEKVRICESFSTLSDICKAKWGVAPLILATGAGPKESSWPYEKVREIIWAEKPLLLLFGTAWGLAEEITQMVDGFLPPIKGIGEYNHLSVRSAAAIILDRLLAERQ